MNTHDQLVAANIRVDAAVKALDEVYAAINAREDVAKSRAETDALYKVAKTLTGMSAARAWDAYDDVATVFDELYERLTSTPEIEALEEAEETALAECNRLLVLYLREQPTAFKLPKYRA